MMQIATVTRQGQLTLPAALRKQMGVSKGGKVWVRNSGTNSVTVDPVPDFLGLKGVFKTKKRFTPKQEREAFANYMAKRHLRKGNFPFPHVSPK